MPTRKQKRRHDKQRRHEYEEVYVDAEGNVVEPDEADAEAPPAARRNGRAGKERPARAKATRSGRTIQPPSLRRVLKRAAIFAPVMFVLVSILPGGGDLSPLTRVLNTLFLVAIFMPFSYLMDSVTYRIWLKRTGQSKPSPRRASK
jgi:hypothetical protein